MKLFKKDTKGKIRFAEFKVEEDTYTVTTGIVGSEKSVPHSKTCVGKNIGKSNETSPEEQAEIELQAKYNKKLKEGYFKTVDEAKNSSVILPMLAKEYGKEKHKIDWSKAVYVQPKLDGMRCLAFIDGKGGVRLMSRKNTNIIVEHGGSMQHIVDELSQIKKECILDGELYAHGLTFQENMKLIKKKRDNSSNVSFHIYDIINDKTYPNRFNDLLKIVPVQGEKCIIDIVETKVTNKDVLINAHKTWLAEGYEGTMIRHGDEGYKINGRSSQLLKYKDFIDEVYEIVDIVPSEVRKTHGVPILKIGEKTFRSGVKGSHKYRAELLTNKDNFIGKMAEIRFFEYTDDGLPRFPIFTGIRLDK